jgi:hypothetical protein
MSPGDSAAVMRRPILAAYGREPDRYGPVVRAFAARLHLDPVRLALDTAGAVVGATTARRIASDAFSWALDSRRSDDVFAESVNLAGTLARDDPRVPAALQRLAEEAAEMMLQGDPPRDRSVWFDASSWRRFTGVLQERLDRALLTEREAVAGVERLTAENAQLAEAVRARTEALAAVRSEAAGTQRMSSARLASGLLKPVAMALADSFESGSLEGTQDRLAAVLAHARIQMGDPPGTVAEFDPRLHQWVGEGRPADHVRILSPAFVARLEGEDASVLVPARVVAADET